MTTVTAEKAVKDIQTQAEKIKNDETQRFPDAASADDAWRQGDLYIVKLPGVPKGAKSDKPRAQLADGSTQGSRHVLDSLDGVSFYAQADAGPLDGPIIDCKTERVLTHPEHGDVILPPGTYAIRYQRDLDAEERERRVLD